MKPTNEQESIIEKAKTLKSQKVNAYAGAGKTSTIKLIGNSMPSKKMLYLAFNKDIVASSKFSSNIEAKTFHSYAFNAVGTQFGSRLTERLYGSIVAEKLKIPNYSSDFKSAYIGNYLLQVIERFCATTDIHISIKHFFEPKDIINPLINTKLLKENFYNRYKTHAEKLWNLMSDLNSDFPSRHCVYAKLWIMTNPKLNFDMIFMDEAQDSDTLMLKLLEAQDCPIIYCGDRYQSIYGWRGAVNAMENIKTEYNSNLTMSFRFGEEIADLSNMILDKEFSETTKLQGNPNVDSKITIYDKPNAILCRTNANVAKTLIDKLAEGYTDIASTGTADAKEFFENVKLLQDNQPAKGKFRLFRSYEELEHYANSSDGKDLKPYITMQNTYGYTKVLKALNSANKDVNNASLVISSAHKAKGLEWDSVMLSDDFKGPCDKGYSLEEARLLYVAITRAKLSLNTAGITQILNDIKEGKKRDDGEGFAEQDRADYNNFIVFLNVPFMEKNKAKSLGARWNPEEKKWWITKSMEQSAFKRWL